MDRESEPTLEELWRVAKVRFKDRTGLSLDQQTTGTSKSCLDLVENTLKPDINLPSSAKKPSRAEKAKQSGIYVIKCLKLLSGVAAQGADFMVSSNLTWLGKMPRLRHALMNKMIQAISRIQPLLQSAPHPSEHPGRDAAVSRRLGRNV